MEDLNNLATNLLTLVEESCNWSNEYSDIAPTALTEALHRSRRKLNKIASATTKRSAVAIFGQSQVGKSYLVQNLAKPNQATYLRIKIPGQETPIDFLTEMNPEGGRESTGVVTRFTSLKLKPAKDHFPIKVELFTLFDLASILGNSYISDIKGDEDYKKPSIDELHKLIEVYSTNKEIALQTEKDLLVECIEYFNRSFSDSYIIRDLKEIGYFDILTKHLLQIDNLDKWRFLEFLWNRNDFLTGLFRKLIKGLVEIEHTRNVFVQQDALSPSSRTILDVQRITDFYNIEESGDLLSVFFDGKTKEIGRSILSALTKEVELQIADDFTREDIRGFVNESDILDFPGSKSREKIPEIVFEHNSLEQKMHLFIRGKVSFLFDSYTNNLGLSALIYCMDHNPPEEKSAPARLAKWVSNYVGFSPESRQNRLEAMKATLEQEGVKTDRVSPLMVVLTKFNDEFAKVLPGQANNRQKHDEKWEARLNENFSKFMMRPVEDKWIENYSGQNSPFNFVFPVRDPIYSKTTFEGLDTKGSEISVRPDQLESLTTMGASFTSSQIVRKHIYNPEEIWEEISTPNNSGIISLCKMLQLSTHPSVAQARLKSDLEEVRQEISSLLAPYTMSDDLEGDLRSAKRKSIETESVVMGLAIKNSKNLSSILKTFVLDEVVVWQFLYDYRLQSFEQNPDTENLIDIKALINDLGQHGIIVQKNSTKDDLIIQFRGFYEGFSDDEINAILQNTLDMRMGDIYEKLNPNQELNESRFVQNLIQFWTKHLYDKVQSQNIKSTLNEIECEVLNSMVFELVKSSRLFGLGKKIHDSIGSLTTGPIDGRSYELIASCCSTLLNNYFFSAGWSLVDLERPRMRNTGEEIFSNKCSLIYEPDLDNFTPQQPNRTFINQWGVGCAALFETNIRQEHGITDVRRESSNIALNQILQEL